MMQRAVPYVEICFVSSVPSKSTPLADANTTLDGFEINCFARHVTMSITFTDHAQ